MRRHVYCVITYRPLDRGLAKGRFGLRVKLPPAHLSTTHGGGFILSLKLIHTRLKKSNQFFHYTRCILHRSV